MGFPFGRKWNSSAKLSLVLSFPIFMKTKQNKKNPPFFLHGKRAKLQHFLFCGTGTKIIKWVSHLGGSEIQVQNWVSSLTINAIMPLTWRLVLLTFSPLKHLTWDLEFLTEGKVEIINREDPQSGEWNVNCADFEKKNGKWNRRTSFFSPLKSFLGKNSSPFLLETGFLIKTTKNETCC